MARFDFVDQDKVEVNKNVATTTATKNNKQTKKEDENEDLLHVHENCFLAGPTRDIPRKRERTIPARVTSHNTFASSCPLAEAQPFHYDV